MNAETATVRYMINDVPAAIAFYKQHLGSTPEVDVSPTYASFVL